MSLDQHNALARFILITLSISLFAFACDDDDAPSVENNAVCGEAMLVEIESTSYCVVTSEIIEQGFRCPPELPVETPMEFGFACSAEGSIPDSHFDILQDNVSRNTPRTSGTSTGGDTTTGNTGTTGSTGEQGEVVITSGLPSGERCTEVQGCESNFLGSYSLVGYCDTSGIAVGFLGEDASASCSDSSEEVVYEILSGSFELRDDETFSLDYTIRITNKTVLNSPCIESAQDCEDIEGTWTGASCVLSRTTLSETSNPETGEPSIKGLWTQLSGDTFYFYDLEPGGEINGNPVSDFMFVTCRQDDLLSVVAGGEEQPFVFEFQAN